MLLITQNLTGLRSWLVSSSFKVLGFKLVLSKIYDFKECDEATVSAGGV